MVQILMAVQSGQRCTVDDLIGMSGVSRRTVFRDLKDLRKAGVPCHCNKKTQYYTIDPKFFLSAPSLSTQEALALLLLVYKARHYTHFPFKDSALRAALKIESSLPGKMRRYCSAALQNISIKADPQVRMHSLDKMFAQLQEAILRKRVVNIRYYLPRERKTIVTDLSPYHLVHSDNIWYVLGKSGLHKRIHPFKLSQIKELNMSDKGFIPHGEFDIAEYLGRAWSMMPEGRLYYIKLKFMPEVAHSVTQVRWHSTQAVTFGEDCSAIVEFCVDGLSEITWWILSYGDQVQVLEPEILRQKIIEIAQNTVRQNEQLSPVYPAHLQ